MREAHRFQTAALSAEALAALRRPRLAPLARRQGDSLKELAQLKGFEVVEAKP